ncbi:MAG: hypothetical protein MAG715_00490 [Methanonatronarchaeales archaeon]|nr:hypothetical protein [Methanonatronarchaeales archaeon]
MTTRDFSGDDVIRVLVNRGNFWIDRVKGDHYTLKWEHPDGSEKRTVTVPRHRSLRTGTLRGIAKQASARDFDEFCRWIDRNR